jgi:hypothetical protein
MPDTVHGTVFADPKMSRKRHCTEDDRCRFVLVLGRDHHEVAVIAEGPLVRHVVEAFRAADPMTVTGWFQDADFTTRSGYRLHDRHLYAESVIKFTPRVLP